MGLQILYRAICLVVGYGFGLFQTAYIIGRIHHIDIREYGSGNSGATNALRVLGSKVGILVFVGDCMKAILACLVVRLTFTYLIPMPEMVHLLVIYAGVGAVLGHVFPAYMGFKGGKGVSCIAGAVISLLDLRIIIACIIVFVLLVLIFRYISLGSIVISVQMWIMHMIFVLQNFKDPAEPVYGLGKQYVIESIIVLGAIGALTIYKHKANIVRLIHGEENKFSFRKKGQVDEKQRIENAAESDKSAS